MIGSPGGDGAISPRSSEGLEPLTHSVWGSAPADEAGGEGEEAVVDVGAVFPVGGQAVELVQQGQGLFDDPACGLVGVAGAAVAGQRVDASFPQRIAVCVGVVAPVGHEGVGCAAGSASASPYRRDRVDQWQELGDVVAVAAGEAYGQRDTASSQITWCFEPVLPLLDRARAGVRAPLSPARARHSHEGWPSFWKRIRSMTWLTVASSAGCGWRLRVALNVRMRHLLPVQLNFSPSCYFTIIIT